MPIDLKNIKKSEMGIPVENTLPYFNEIIEQVIIPAENDYSEFMHNINAIDLKECIIILEQLLTKLDGKLKFLRIKHLFIDEFQDTDDVQIRVFQLIQKATSSDCRLFVVGDLKQSIYRFRGAKLSAFNLLKQDSLFNWNQHYLMINYRSDTRLLDAFDMIFENMANEGYLPYSKANDQLVSNVVTDVDADKLFYSVPCRCSDEKKRMETFINILSEQKLLIENLITERKLNNKSNLSKAERTIAILVRSNWQVDDIVNVAKSNGFDIDVKSGGDLFQIESTIDLYKLIMSITNCTNPLYLINLLESNYIKLNGDYSKYHNSTNKDCYSDLTRILNEYFVKKTGKSWDQIINEAYSQPVLYVINQLFNILQPWKQYSKNSYQQKYYIANYEYLIERIIKFSNIDSLTLNYIAEYLKINILSRQQQLARDVETNDDEIQIICTTIHKSKGLEYGTVILPFTDDDISDMRKVKLDANYANNKLSYTILFENKIRERNTNYDDSAEVNEQILEESRILYVALTRAIRNCVWIDNLDSNPTISWGTLLEG